LSVFPQHCHNVINNRHSVDPFILPVPLGPLKDLSLLLPVHSLLRHSETAACPCFDLDKRRTSVPPGNHIDLAHLAFLIFIENFALFFF